MERNNINMMFAGIKQILYLLPFGLIALLGTTINTFRHAATKIGKVAQSVLSVSYNKLFQSAASLAQSEAIALNLANSRSY